MHITEKYSNYAKQASLIIQHIVNVLVNLKLSTMSTPFHCFHMQKLSFAFQYFQNKEHSFYNKPPALIEFK